MTLREVAENLTSIGGSLAKFRYSIINADVAFLINGWVEERQRRIRMEWQITHDCAKHSEWADNPSFLHCAQPQHTWTDNDWHTQALRELDLMGVGLGEEKE